ncbi:MAG: ribosomal protein S18-alanine N-acetyltransferase [Clostridia bacterium]
MNELIIAKMTLSDFNALSDILISDFDDFWNENILKSELQNPFSTYIMAKLGNKIVGFAGMIDTIDQMEITNIVVKKDYRKNGIGNILLNRLISLAKENKKTEIILEVNENNISAIKLYEKNGFRKCGLRKRYYNNTDNAIIMNLKIN